MKRKADDISLDDLHPYDLEGTVDDISLVERALAALARKQRVWTLLVQDWKQNLAKRDRAHAAPADAEPEPEPEPEPELDPPPDPASSSARVFYLAHQSADPMSVNALVGEYRSDERSPYHGLRHATRTNYESLLKRIQAQIGTLNVSDLTPAKISQLHSGWSTKGATISHSLVTMLRTLVLFGANILDDKDCREVAFNMHHMDTSVFKAPKSMRTERMTEKHVKDIIRKAHDLGHPSIALAQALQWDLRLPQKDVIGEFVPMTEKENALWTDGERKWLRGVHWSEIDDKLVLRHITSQTGESISVDLTTAPNAWPELQRLGPSEAQAGPVVVSEETKAPYTAIQFRRLWRAIADAANVPKGVRNMDARLAADDDRNESEEREDLSAARRR